MSLWGRLLTNIYLVLFNLFFIALIAVSFGIIPSFYFNQVVENIYGNWQLSGFLIILLVGGLYLLFKGRKKSESSRHRSIIQYTELGELKITLDAIESLTERSVVQQIRGVRDVKPKAYKSEKGLGIGIVLSTVPDLNLPELSKNVQDVVFKDLQDTVGIAANPITVTIKNIVKDGISVK
jgi:hypothetical protein